MRMHVLKRSFLSVKRTPFKSMLLFTLILILSLLVAGAILARQAIVNTDKNLRRQMPGVVQVEQDWTIEVDEETVHEFLSPDVIEEISALPQVRSFDYALDMSWGVSSRMLSPWSHPTFPDLLSEYDDVRGLRLRVRGVNHADFLEVRRDFLTLVAGRSFDPSELEATSDVYPVLISTGLAEVNGLRIGSIIEAEVLHDKWDELIGENVMINEAGHFPLEVIGIFEPTLTEMSDGDNLDEAFQTYVQEATSYHRIYVPNWIAHLMFEARASDSNEPNEVFFHNFFMLNDPLDVTDFSREIQDLPGNWKVVDLSTGFSELSASMATLSDVADGILWGSVVSILFIIGLLIALFLRDRKHEIGIYLALGERKKQIVLQLVGEVLSIALIGMTIALFLSHLLAGPLSREMLRQNLAMEFDRQEQVFNPLEELGYRFEMSPEEMLEAYEIRIDLETAGTFYVIGITATLTATLLPVLRTVKLNPKKALLS